VNDFTTRLRVPGEDRVIDAAFARGMRNRTLGVARDLGFDKVTAAVVMLDLAVELLATNDPRYGPEVARELLERAVVVHYGEEIR
jgi:hypothetical protein